MLMFNNVKLQIIDEKSQFYSDTNTSYNFY